ncbi:non-homologous end-joining DNA ligase [Salana multivorans]
MNATGGLGSSAPEVTEIGGHRVRLTNRDKLLFPGDEEHPPTTKRELVAYYRRIAPTMLPHLAGRPVTRKRWPNGTGEPSFFTKNLDSGTPDWIPRAPIEHRQRVATYPLFEEEAALAWAAQMAAIELHVPQWRLPASARGESPETYVLENATANPDRLVVDLDPGPGTPMRDVARVALAARDILESIGLTTVPVTSGSKGIHLYAGLTGVSSAQAKEVSTELAKALAAELPDLVVTSMKRAIRDGKVFVDHSQNNQAKTTVSPYSVRGRARPWVAAPRTWAEVEAGAEGEPLPQLTMSEVLERVERDGDLLARLLPTPTPTSTPSATPPAAEVDPPSRPARPHRPPASTPRRLPTLTRSIAGLPSPMLASTLTPEREAQLTAVDAGERWLFEPKWDGYRVLVVVGPAKNNGATHDGDENDDDATAVALVSRTGRDITQDMSTVAPVAPELAGHAGILDAEVVALDDAGLAQLPGAPEADGGRPAAAAADLRRA